MSIKSNNSGKEKPVLQYGALTESSIQNKSETEYMFNKLLEKFDKFELKFDNKLDEVK